MLRRVNEKEGKCEGGERRSGIVRHTLIWLDRYSV